MARVHPVRHCVPLRFLKSCGFSGKSKSKTENLVQNFWSLSFWVSGSRNWTVSKSTKCTKTVLVFQNFWYCQNFHNFWKSSEIPVYINVTGNCGNWAFPEMPRQLRKCLEFPQLPKHLWKELLKLTIFKFWEKAPY